MELDVNSILDRLSQQIGKLTVEMTLKDLQILTLQKELQEKETELNKLNGTKEGSHE